MNSMLPPSRHVRVVVAALIALMLGLSLAGCGGSDKSTAAKKPVSQPTQGGTTLAALWPLTGEKATGEPPAHPVLIVKYDNTPNSQPQLGLNKADLITEELVEGGITRIAVAFYSQLPEVIGPVRSMRASDMGIVKPTHGALVASGAAPPTIARLNANKVKFFTEGGPGYYRDGSRHAPYNLFVHIRELAKTLKKSAIVPANYLPWGTETDFAGNKAATSIAVRFSPGHTTNWKREGGKYVNTNSFAASDQKFNPDNVLVLRVREGDAGYLDPAGHHVPETIYKGTGNLMLFHNGKVMTGTWSKKDLDSVLKLKGANGKDLKVPAGRTWIELVPQQNQGGSISFN